MNGSMIRVILGHVLKIEAAFMLLPCLVSLIYGEKQGLTYLIVACICAVIGFAMTSIYKPKDTSIYLKEGCVATALSWIFLSAFGAIPFWMTKEIPSYVDALFETISGFTTTGATILTDVEVISYTSLFWRSSTHWLGGMGVLVFLLAIIPMSGGSNINLMRAESPGPSVGKLVPRVRSTALILYGIYLGITVVETIALMCTGLRFYDALVLTFSTVGTGGFGILNDSIGSYSVATQTVFTIFMLACGVNFSAYYLILRKNFKEAFKMEEVKWYFIIVAISAILITVNIRGTYGSIRMDFHHALFQVATIITTTGFSTVDFDKWPEFSKAIIFLLMLGGACAGSTGGGFKVSRVIVMIKSMKNEITMAMHPRSVKKIHMDNKIVPDNIVYSIRNYLIIYVSIYLGSFLIVSINGFDFTTNFTAVAACLNNIGPGFSLVGPTGNYGAYSVLSKLILIIDMLAGRLELMPVLMLFHLKTWKE